MGVAARTVVKDSREDTADDRRRGAGTASKRQRGEGTTWIDWGVPALSGERSEQRPRGNIWYDRHRVKRRQRGRDSRELEVGREERLRANEVLTRTLGAKRTVENALSSVCETELRVRFRLHEATDHVLKLAQAGMPEIGAILDGKNERIDFLEKRLGFAEENLRKANEARKKAENLAEEAMWKVAETNGSCTYFNAKFVQLTVQGERIKAECKSHEAKVEGMCAALEHAESSKKRWLL